MIMLHDGVVEDHVAELIASEMKKVHWKYDYHSRVVLNGDTSVTP